MVSVYNIKYGYNYSLSAYRWIPTRSYYVPTTQLVRSRSKVLYFSHVCTKKRNVVVQVVLWSSLNAKTPRTVADSTQVLYLYVPMCDYTIPSLTQHRCQLGNLPGKMNAVGVLSCCRAKNFKEIGCSTRFHTGGMPFYCTNDTFLSHSLLIFLL